MSVSVVKTIALVALIAPALLAEVCAQPTRHNYLDGDDLAWFYNRPGVTLEQYRSDDQYCANVAATAVGGPPAAGTYGSGLAADILSASLTPGWINGLHDNCMRVRGYRRFELRPGRQRDFVRELTQASDELRLQYVSAITPPAGVFASEWRNEFLGSQTSVFAADLLTPAAPTELLRRPEVFNQNFYYYRGRTAEELTSGATLDPNKATVVLAMSTSERTAFNRSLLLFLRTSPETGAVPGANDHPTFINLAEWDRDREPGRYQIFQVPPGRYALWRHTDASNKTADFCLRTTAFDVDAGDVVYAGRWSLSGSQLDVTMNDTEAAQQALALLAPDLGERMELATYHNGVRLPCGAHTLQYFFQYGIDLPLRQE